MRLRPHPGRVRPLLRSLADGRRSSRGSATSAPTDWAAVARDLPRRHRDAATRPSRPRCPPWEEWDAAHLAAPRSSPSSTSEVVGWAALAPRLDARACYRGVAENSVYVARERAGPRASAARCSSALVARRERAGIWTIQTGDLPRERGEPGAAPPRRLPRRRRPRAASAKLRRPLARHRPAGTTKRGDQMIKVEAVVIRERVETVIDAVEEATGHVGVTVIEAVGHGRAARDHARVPRARLRVALPAEGAADVRRRGRASPRPSSRRSSTRRAAATSRATGSSGRRPSRTSCTTGPACRLEEVEVG